MKKQFSITSGSKITMSLKYSIVGLLGSVTMLLTASAQAVPMVQAVARSNAGSTIVPHDITIDGFSGPVTASNGPATATTNRRMIDLSVDGANAAWSPDGLSAFGQNESHYGMYDLNTMTLLDPLLAADVNVIFQFSLQGRYENNTPISDIMTNSYIDVGLTPLLQPGQFFSTDYSAICSGGCSLDNDGDYRMVPSNPPVTGDVNFGFELLHKGANQGSMYMAMNAMASAGDFVRYNLELTGVRFDAAPSAYPIGILFDDNETRFESPTQVPEPSTILLLSAGIVGLAFWRKNKSLTR